MIKIWSTTYKNTVGRAAALNMVITETGAGAVNEAAHEKRTKTPTTFLSR
jgi:hypothetical protein